MGGCCESQHKNGVEDMPDLHFSYKDVVPVKHHSYQREYDVVKLLPSTKERVSKD